MEWIAGWSVTTAMMQWAWDQVLSFIRAWGYIRGHGVWSCLLRFPVGGKRQDLTLGISSRDLLGTSRAGGKRQDLTPEPPEPCAGEAKGKT
jgi:hypothetical protein